MPVAWLRTGGVGGFAPLARPRFLLGSDLDCDLVDASEGVAEYHATVRLRRGEYVLVAEDGCALWVNGDRVPLISLRDGDRVALAPDATPWRFRSRVEGTFWPPNISLGEAWLAHPEFDKTLSGPRRFGDGRPLEGHDPLRSRLVAGPHGALVVTYLGRVGDARAATDYLRFLASIGGAVHPSLAPVLDGGLTLREGVAWRWIGTRFLQGTPARDLIAAGPLEVRRVVGILQSIAEGVAHLHHRGIVHRSISPDSVLLLPTGQAVLTDYGMAYSSESRVPPSFPEGAGGDGVAPEVGLGGDAALAFPVDVYGLAALGCALLTGGAATGASDLEAHSPVIAEGEREAWDALVPLLQEALAIDPASRPAALLFAQALRSLGERDEAGEPA